MEKLFAIDGNWYLYRAMSTLRSYQPVEEILPYHFLSMIFRDALRVRSPYIMIAFDGPSVFRYRIYKDYKANRRKTSDTEQNNKSKSFEQKDLMYACLPNVYNLLSSVGVCYYQPRNYEADDVLCSIAYKYQKKYNVVIGTGDKDSYQYLTHNVCLYNSARKGKDGKSRPEYIRAEDVFKKKGVLPEQMVDYQILLGDKQDNIPGISEMKPLKVKKILAEFGSVLEWAKRTSEGKNLITRNQDILIRNRKLVTLTTTCSPPQEIAEWKLPKIKTNNSKLEKSYYEFHNFVWPKAKSLF